MQSYFMYFHVFCPMWFGKTDSVCQFPWCKHPHHGWVHPVLTREKVLIVACASQLQNHSCCCFCQACDLLGSLSSEWANQDEEWLNFNRGQTKGSKENIKHFSLINFRHYVTYGVSKLFPYKWPSSKHRRACWSYTVFTTYPSSVAAQTEPDWPVSYSL